MNSYARVGAIFAMAGFVAPASGTIINLSNVPDLSQHSGGSWANYCGPTNGSNVAYYFGQTYSGLVPGDTFPFASSSAADAIIAGASSPPPVLGSMAQRMSTTVAGGTTGNNLRDGLDLYLEDNYDATPGGTNWTTDYHDAAGLTGSGFWALLQNEIANGSGIILLIAWTGGIPGGYDVPEDYSAGISATSAMGHAVTMTGFDTNITPFMHINDPANNGGSAHNFGGEGAAYGVTINPTSLGITLSGSNATIYGAVITNIPTPGAMSLLGLAGLFTLRRRRRAEA
ncbi:MAG: hypothetical protein O7G85_00165 [Planctomycetota bacterium]|nr:hypothetical protein [Planctomycetota bacterium]